ncbi:ABC transporter permease [Paenibacillus sp. N1-5-1-14]|uniref:ABC transporter permease n=1 Tax=Paenibacillus radicibacter TaxID=2972488 RepID=UPI0021590585|nr:ABC transporter permease subunit [Paenibacillus radicibacter]MCR8645541.1 ABC transporter permease [Paenibacillus radicibacter]
MRQFTLFYRKEMLEMVRSYKWVWVPVAFMLLGVMQPVTSYYMPEILKHAGNMPQGTIITIPTPSSGEVLAQTINQYGTIGVLVLVLAMMGMIASEMRSGVGSMIFAKPISMTTYMSAKWASMMTLTTVSFLLGYAGAWYYTVQLFGNVDVNAAIQAGFIYLLWLLCICSIVLFVSAWLPHAAGVAFVSLIVIVLLSTASSLMSGMFPWNPSQLGVIASSLLVSGEIGQFPIASIISATLVVMVLCWFVSIPIMRKQRVA